MIAAGFRQPAQPGRQRPRLPRIPKRREIARPLDLVQVRGLTGELQGLDETIATFTGPGVVAEATKTEMSIAPLKKMLGAEMADTHVVRPNLRHAGLAAGVSSLRSTSGTCNSAHARTRAGVVCRLMTPCHFLLCSQRGSTSACASSSRNAAQCPCDRPYWAMPFNIAVESSKRVRKTSRTWGLTVSMIQRSSGEASARAGPPPAAADSRRRAGPGPARTGRLRRPARRPPGALSTPTRSDSCGLR